VLRVNDPVNRIDPSGSEDDGPSFPNFGICPNGTITFYGGAACTNMFIGSLFGGFNPFGQALSNLEQSIYNETIAPFVAAESEMKQAMAKAKSALDSKSSCRQLFGTDASRATANFNPDSVLNTLYSQAGSLLPKATLIAGVPVASSFTFGFLLGGEDATVGYAAVAVGTSSPYVAPAIQVYINVGEWNSEFQAGDVSIMAATLLHEMGHVYDLLAGAGSGGSKILDDSSSQTVSQQNTALVLTDCGLTQ
jgi:hypothetical protein